MIPGIILLLVIGAITGWSAHVIGEFKRRHPHCHSVADVGQMWWGPVGREVFGALYWLCKYTHTILDNRLDARLTLTSLPSQT
jgi:amino acid permease